MGTQLDKVASIIEERLTIYQYSVRHVSISRDIIPQCTTVDDYDESDEYERISALMNAGNNARWDFKEYSILALYCAAWISSERTEDKKENKELSPRTAYIIRSLKHPDEVVRFRQLYPQGFYLVGVHSDDERRHSYLTNEKGISSENATKLMCRDEHEHLKHGQKVADTFHLSDIFVLLDGDDDKLKNNLWRFLRIIFADPYCTPTFDEYAMFLAFSASLRSADMSRQVGAVIAKDQEILATGANDCPKYGGGLYWPIIDPETKTIADKKGGRDHTRGKESNTVELQKIIDEIVEQGVNKGLDEESLREALDTSRIPDLTEFGRVVHAEMEALLCCSRNKVSSKGTTLYSTLFPCHNCAKHIIAAGIERVVYVEPYSKSKACEFHDDAIQPGFAENKGLVKFQPFFGIGPRRFFDLFSMKLGSGFPLSRKDDEGKTVKWEEPGDAKWEEPGDAHLRLQMLPCSYLELEVAAGDLIEKIKKEEGLENA